ncbi:MAG: deoxyguanosinetriphosphate triphosphohydrolase [Alphaproteobacteria bacterium]|nr:deoxyguanosinetriphosphate triphosphohydrolase [Alphaproteobacteria bacterium]
MRASRRIQAPCEGNGAFAERCFDLSGFRPSQDLAPFASRAETSRGRQWNEPESVTRSPYMRDRDRVIHSGAFRRMKHKTQVFVYHEGDYYRTRLTHSLEVAQIARSICRVMRLDEDLAEALALAHDLGHAPFGHAGEDALAAAMKPFGGFDHNAHSLRLVTKLEQRYAEFDGLNLSWETLEGIVKHNGPLTGPLSKQEPLPQSMAEFNAAFDLKLDTFASAEAQVAALADDIAYNNHDIDDGLRAGLFTIEELESVPLVGGIFTAVADKYPGLERSRLVHESVRRLITAMIDDALHETQRRINELKLQSADDVRSCGKTLVSFSDSMRANDRALKAFLFKNMYRHFKVNRMLSKAKRVVTDLFALFLSEPGVLPTQWNQLCDAAGTTRTARVVSDYIAGMTDRFALEEHRRLFAIEVDI